MLTIQPQVLNNYRPAFKSNENVTEEELLDLSSMDEDSFESAKKEVLDVKGNLEELATGKLPALVNKALKLGALGAGSIVAGMAGGWGTGKTIEGFQKLLGTKVVKNLTKGTKKVSAEVLGNLGKINNKIKTSNIVTKFVQKDKSAYTAFGEKSFGKPIVKVLNKIGEGIKFVYKKAADGIKFVYNKIKGVKAETYKKATANTVGVSTGIASGVTALREKSEAGEI